MKMHRSDAINLLAYFYLLNTTTAARFDILVDVLSENEEYENVKDPNSEVYNDNIRTYLRDELKGVANVFIAAELLQYTGKHIQINGEVESLEACPCCGFKTLGKRGEYEICKLCNWEDTGNIDINSHCGCNHGSIFSYRENLSSNNPAFYKNIKYVLFEKKW